jgi:hypothetical protein
MLGLIPIWHAIHASESVTVSYNVEYLPSEEPLADWFRSTGVYRHMTTSTTAPTNQYPGGWAFESLLKFVDSPAAAREVEADVVAWLWRHDDAIIMPNAVHAWLSDPSYWLSAVHTFGRLPRPVSGWPGDPYPWAHSRSWEVEAGKNLSAYILANNLCDLSLNSSLEGIDKLIFHHGQSDILGLRKNCPACKRFLQFLRAGSVAKLFLEITVPTARMCLIPANHSLLWHLLTPNTRQGPLWFMNHGQRKEHQVIHPLKLSDPVAALAHIMLRDEGWLNL